ncbi:MAG TPA: hypothetical protein VK826_15590 [Bacteroidia bacterium]|nr:hypothetical protein [Bacteroidia bacterium]
MLKKLIPFILSLWFSIPASAQELTTDWGNTLELTNDLRNFTHADSLGNLYFLTSNKNGDWFIEKQEAGAAKSSFSTEIISGDKNAPEFKRLFATTEGFIVVSAVSNKKASTTTYYYNTVGFDGRKGQATDKEFLVIIINKKEWPGSSQVLASPDRSKFVVTFRGTESQEFTWYGFDSGFKSLFTKTSGMYKNSKHGLVAASSFSMTNNGDIIYYAEKITVKKKGKWEGSELWLFVLPASSQTTDSVAIKPTGKSFLSFEIFPDGDNVVLFGLCREQYAASGIYFSTYSISGKTFSVEKNTPLEAAQFVTPGALDASKGKPSIGPGNLSVIKNANGYYGVIDPVFRQASAAPGGGSTVMYTLYTMQVISVSTEGKVNWISTIFRDQICKEMSGAFGIGGAFSVTTSVKLRQDDLSLFGAPFTMMGEDLVFVMNDAAENAPQVSSSSKVAGVRKTKELTAQAVRITPDGKVIKEVVMGKNGAPTRWHVAYAIASRGHIYTVADDGESTRLVDIH